MSDYILKMLLSKILPRVARLGGRYFSSAPAF